MSYTEADFETVWQAGFRCGKWCAELEAIRKEVKEIAMKEGFDVPDMVREKP